MRQAKCTVCSRVMPSKESLAFFEYKGEGSRLALISCKNCPYYAEAHGKNHMQVCGEFIPHGSFEYDGYYCGCSGWE